MPIDALGPVRSPEPTPPDAAAGARPSSAGGELPAFAAVLQQKLAEPRQALADVRTEIASIRNGGVFRAPPQPAGPDLQSASMSSDIVATSRLLELRQTAMPGADPYGWRDMTRAIGDSVVGDGFGALFERQIQQESGFAPDVVLGLRKSSAGAEGIAQLMPQYYPGVNRTDPQESLIAGAQSMRHYLEAWDGDTRRAMASYNAGLGRVRSLIDAHGDDWERGLPTETKQYLAAILGPTTPTIAVPVNDAAAVFGGRGPGGVLISPLDRPAGHDSLGPLLRLYGAAGIDVRAMADGRVTGAGQAGDGTLSVTLDHGNGWTSLVQGLADLQIRVGDTVRRADVLGRLAGANGAAAADGDEAALTVGVLLNGRALDPGRYLLTGNR